MAIIMGYSEQAQEIHHETREELLSSSELDKQNNYFLLI